MRVKNWDDWSEGYCPSDITVDVQDHSRISALLGPDGNPLKVGYERPKVGFDLTRRAIAAEVKNPRIAAALKRLANR